MLRRDRSVLISKALDATRITNLEHRLAEAEARLRPRLVPTRWLQGRARTPYRHRSYPGGAIDPLVTRPPHTARAFPMVKADKIRLLEQRVAELESRPPGDERSVERALEVLLDLSRRHGVHLAEAEAVFARMDAVLGRSMALTDGHAVMRGTCTTRSSTGAMAMCTSPSNEGSTVLSPTVTGGAAIVGRLVAGDRLAAEFLL